LTSISNGGYVSDGLKFLSAVIQSGSPRPLLEASAEYFLDHEEEAYSFIKRHYRAYRELPTRQTVQEETGVRLPDTREPIAYYVDTLHDRYDYNLIREHYDSMRSGLQEKNMTTVRDSVQQMSRVIRRSSRAGTSVATLSEGIEMSIDRLLRIQGSGGVSGITTPWPWVDEQSGGYQNGDMIAWVGRMGLGKTYIALLQAYAAYQAGKSVLFVTTEMVTEALARRTLAIALGLNPSILKSGNVSTYMLRRIQAFSEQLAGIDRFRVFSIGMKANTASVEALAQEFLPDVIYIDGFYLMRPAEGSKNMSRTDRVASVCDETKGLALDLDRPVVVMTQFNRQAGSKGKEGSLETISFSDAIGTHSSVVAAVKNGPIPKDSRMLEFLKGREGETGSWPIWFKFAPLNMRQMTAEEAAAAGGTVPGNLDDSGAASVDWMGAN
jgi:replicative DNA helicase